MLVGCGAHLAGAFVLRAARDMPPLTSAEYGEVRSPNVLTLSRCNKSGLSATGVRKKDQNFVCLTSFQEQKSSAIAICADMW